MYETMVYWETVDDEHPVSRDYAEIWRAADKVVYSRTLKAASSARTRIEREFDPEAVRAMKAPADRDLTVGGPHLAAEALRAGLVDDLQVLFVPHVVGGGNRALPDGLRVSLELVDEHRFSNGTVFLHYRVTA
jgi:dihydrofolate reductase